MPRVPSRDPIVGTLVAGYRIEERIGAGGMGTVYRAIHVLLERTVAVKVVRDDLPSAARRFQQEARAASAVDHENVVRILDFGRSDAGFLYLVMEYVEGMALSDLLARDGSMRPARAVGVAIQIAAALDAAAEKEVVHRDLKPDNVILASRSDRDVVKVLDFGLAKILGRSEASALTATGAVFGTPAYMSPEQCRGAAVDLRSDLYALGVLLYEMLAGSPPFHGTNAAIFRAQMSEAPPPIPACPPRLWAIVARCLEKDPAERFESARELRASLEALATPAPAPAPKAPVDTRATEVTENGLLEQVAMLHRRREQALVEIGTRLAQRRLAPASVRGLVAQVRARETERVSTGEALALLEASLEEEEKKARASEGDALRRAEAEVARVEAALRARVGELSRIEAALADGYAALSRELFGVSEVARREVPGPWQVLENLEREIADRERRLG